MAEALDGGNDEHYWDGEVADGSDSGSGIGIDITLNAMKEVGMLRGGLVNKCWSRELLVMFRDINATTRLVYGVILKSNFHTHFPCSLRLPAALKCIYTP